MGREVLVVGRTRPSPPDLLRLLAPMGIGILLHRVQSRRGRGLPVAADNPALVHHPVQEGRDAAFGQLEFEHHVMKRGGDWLGKFPDNPALTGCGPPRRTGDDPVHALDVAHPLRAFGVAATFDLRCGVQDLVATPAPSPMGFYERMPRPSAVLAGQTAVLVLDVHDRFDEASVWHDGIWSI